MLQRYLLAKKKGQNFAVETYLRAHRVLSWCRFTALLNVAYVAYPPKEQLQQVYCEYLGVLMGLPPLNKHSVWGGGKNADELSNTLVWVGPLVFWLFTQVCMICSLFPLHPSSFSLTINEL